MSTTKSPTRESRCSRTEDPRKGLFRSGRGRLATAVIASAATLGAVLAPLGAAQASDWGGYANPASCGSNYIVKQETVYSGSGQNLGQLQIKYSNGCPGNFARFQAAGGVVPNHIALSIKSQTGAPSQAGTDEYGKSIAYTYVIRLSNPSDRVCAYLDVWTSTQSSKVLCA